VDMLTLRASDTTVLAATHGRGLFTTTFSYDVTTSIPESTAVAFNIYYSESAGKLFVDAGSGLQAPTRLRLYSLDGRLVSDQTEWNAGKLTFDVPAMATGIMLAHITFGRKEYTRKIMVE